MVTEDQLLRYWHVATGRMLEHSTNAAETNEEGPEKINSLACPFLRPQVSTLSATPTTKHQIRTRPDVANFIQYERETILYELRFSNFPNGTSS